MGQAPREIVSTTEFRSLRMELDRLSQSQQAPRDIGSSIEFRTLKMELDREMKRRFDEWDRRCEDTNRRFEDTNRRVEDSNHRFEELSRSVNQIGRSTHESGMSEMMHRLNDECAERQMGDNVMHQLISSLAEQTNLALEEEASQLWEALRTHNHDIMIDSAEQAGKKSIQIQALAGNGGCPGKSRRTIQLNPMPFSSPMPATHPSGQESPMMGCRDLALPAIHTSTQEMPMMGYRDFAPKSPSPQVATSMSQRTFTATAPNSHKPTYASTTTSR